MIGDFQVSVDRDSDITIKGKRFRGTPGLWELLTRRKIQRDKLTSDDLRAYKKILLLTNGHLTGYVPDGNIHISSGTKFRDIRSNLFQPQNQEAARC